MRAWACRYRRSFVRAVTAQELAEKPFLVSVLDPATRPDHTKPRRPFVLLNLLVAVGAAVVLALVVAFMSDHFDHRIKSIDDAEKYLGVPVLASVPRLGRRIVRRR